MPLSQITNSLRNNPQITGALIGGGLGAGAGYLLGGKHKGKATALGALAGAGLGGWQGKALIPQLIDRLREQPRVPMGPDGPQFTPGSVMDTLKPDIMSPTNYEKELPPDSLTSANSASQYNIDKPGLGNYAANTALDNLMPAMVSAPGIRGLMASGVRGGGSALGNIGKAYSHISSGVPVFSHAAGIVDTIANPETRQYDQFGRALNDPSIEQKMRGEYVRPVTWDKNPLTWLPSILNSVGWVTDHGANKLTKTFGAPIGETFRTAADTVTGFSNTIPRAVEGINGYVDYDIPRSQNAAKNQEIFSKFLNRMNKTQDNSLEGAQQNLAEVSRGATARLPQLYHDAVAKDPKFRLSSSEFDKMRQQLQNYWLQNGIIPAKDREGNLITNNDHLYSTWGQEAAKAPDQFMESWIGDRLKEKGWQQLPPTITRHTFR